MFQCYFIGRFTSAPLQRAQATTGTGEQALTFDVISSQGRKQMLSGIRHLGTYPAPNHHWKENDSVFHKQLDVLFTKEFLFFFF